MKVAVGVPCREQGRWSTFWECVGRLRVPSGWEMVEPIVRYDNSVARARNKIAVEGLKQDLDAILWLDDDMIFDRNVLSRLLIKPEDVIIGLTLSRCMIDGNSYRPIWSDKEIEMTPDGPVWTPVADIKVGPNGLMPLLSGTGGGVLTRMGVFKVVEGPWWTIGQIDPEMFWEDIYAYQKMRAAGVKIWGDPNTRFGHYQPTVVWPNQRPDGSWSTVLAHGFEGFLEQPWASTVPAEV